MSDTIQHPACSKCHQVDDHPRHLVIRVMDVGQLVPDAVADQATIDRLEAAYNTADHLDCCDCTREFNNGVESCAEIVNRAEGRKGAELREHLAQNPRQGV